MYLYTSKVIFLHKNKTTRSRRLALVCGSSLHLIKVTQNEKELPFIPLGWSTWTTMCLGVNSQENTDRQRTDFQSTKERKKILLLSLSSW